jgi:hypothetical protein
MRIVTNLAAAIAVAAVPLHGGPTTAAPLSQPLAISRADTGTVEEIQYRRWDRRGRWFGPARGYYRGYYPVRGNYRGYYYGGRQEWWRLTPQYGSCTGDREMDSGYPSWACR